MKIAIIADSHDNLANLKKAISWLKKEKIKVCLHCGDICTSSTLREVLKNFAGKFHIVSGKADKEHWGMEKMPLKNLKNVKIWGEIGKIKLDGKRIAFTHFSKIAKELAKSQKPAPLSAGYDVVFYGHSHKPWLEKINKTWIINPGNLAGLFYKASFAVYDTKTGRLELKILEKLDKRPVFPGLKDGK